MENILEPVDAEDMEDDDDVDVLSEFGGVRARRQPKKSIDTGSYEAHLIDHCSF